jgi:hypothetical protein
MKREILSVVGAIAVIIILAILLSERVFVLSDVSSALAWVFVASIFGILIWGFKPKIERAIRGKTREKEKVDTVLDRKLTEVYSPIHAMIAAVNSEIPRGSVLQLTVGAWVKASLVDFNNISAVFNQHVHELRDKDLEMWLKIEKEIKQRGGFYLGKDRQEWFDELEAEYNRLTEHYRG